jgi:transcriptional regulator with XRE-family HTH domain
METLRVFLSANIKARREALGISQEKLAELADVSIQMIKAVEGRRNWVSDTMLAKLAYVLGVNSFQLLLPTGGTEVQDDKLVVFNMLASLRKGIKTDIDSRFDKIMMPEHSTAQETAGEENEN